MRQLAMCASAGGLFSAVFGECALACYTDVGGDAIGRGRSGPDSAGGDPPNASVSFDGIVFVDRDHTQQRWALSNVISGERVVLTAPFADECVLVFGDEGDGEGVVASDDPTWEPRLLSDLLSQRVVIKGGALGLRNASDGQDLGTIESLNCSFEIGSLQSQFGPTRADLALDLVYFLRPRDGCKCFFSIASVYDVAKFEFSYNFRSVWVHKNMGAWKSLLAGLGLQGHILQSRPCDGSLASHVERPAPFVTISSTALIALSASWAFSSARWCGMKRASNALAAQALMEGLLILALGEAWVLWLFLGGDEQYSWPRPSTGSYPVGLPVDKDGSVDLAPLEAVLAAEGDDGGNFAVAASLLVGMLQAEKVKLCDFLSQLATQRKHTIGTRIMIQVVRAIGAEIERKLQEMSDGEAEHKQCKLELNSLDPSSDYKLDRALKRYTDMACQSFSDIQFASIASDCSRVGTQALQTAFLVTDQNKACWLVPQALRFGRFLETYAFIRSVA